MKSIFQRLLLLSLFAIILPSQCILGNTYEVNSLASTNTGAGNSGTLLYCISQANLSTGPHTIGFSVAGTINISSSASLLPALTKQIIIDATTAPGYAGIPVVLLNGAGSSGNGIQITAANCELYGLEIANFSYRGIYINGSVAAGFIIGAAGKGNVIRDNGYYGIDVNSADNGIIAYNKVGTDATGFICAGNNYDGINLQGAANYTQILFNHVSCNGYNGIQIGGSSYNEIKGNIIGPLSDQCAGNEYRGIDIEDGSQYNVVGGTNISEFNKIAGNYYWGIEVKNNSPNNLLSGNSYLCNDYGAIALSNNGNNTMPAPAVTTANSTTISGTAQANAVIQIFKSQNTNPSQCAGTPTNQGADFIGSTVADNNGNWSLSGNFGGYVTATATDINDNTSQFCTAVSTGISDTLINACSGYIPSLSASFNTSASTVCEKQCIDYTDQSQNAVAWQWTFEGGVPSTSTQQTPGNVCYSDPGVFTTTLVVFDANGIDSAVALLVITVNATPAIPEISQQNDTLISTSAVSYQWYLNTIEIPGATGQQYIATENGFYSVQITDSAGCTAISTADYINITGIVDLDASWINAGYIATSQAIGLTMQHMAIGAGQIVVYDLLGRPVAQHKITIPSSPLFFEIPFADKSAGIYFLQLKTSRGIFADQFLVP